MRLIVYGSVALVGATLVGVTWLVASAHYWWAIRVANGERDEAIEDRAAMQRERDWFRRSSQTLEKLTAESQAERQALEAKLARYQRKHGTDGRFTGKES